MNKDFKEEIILNKEIKDEKPQIDEKNENIKDSQKDLNKEPQIDENSEPVSIEVEINKEELDEKIRKLMFPDPKPELLTEEEEDLL